MKTPNKSILSGMRNDMNVVQELTAEIRKLSDHVERERRPPWRVKLRDCFIEGVFWGAGFAAAIIVIGWATK